MKRNYLTMSTRVRTSLIKWMMSRRVGTITLRRQSSGSSGPSMLLLAPVRPKSCSRDARL
jgi:hypothetical protein